MCDSAIYASSTLDVVVIDGENRIIVYGQQDEGVRMERKRQDGCAGLLQFGTDTIHTLALFLAKVGVLFNFIERGFAHAALAIPLRRVVLVILKHQLRIGFIREQAVAELNKICVLLKG